MHDPDHFFMRDPWTYDSTAPKPESRDAHLGFDTRALHAGFSPAELEGGQACVTAGSGSQALFNLIFTLARPGDNVVTSLNIFGEGYKQAATIFPERCNVTFRFVENPADLIADLDQALQVS